MTDEERRELEKKALEEQRLKEAMAEKEPEWQLFCDLKGDDQYLNPAHWKNHLDYLCENQGAGDEDDRWKSLNETFALTQVSGQFEEYDGINHEASKQFVIVVHLPMLVRGNAVQIQATEEFIKVRIPSLYKLELGLPSSIEHKEARSFFDCKIRRLIIVMPVLPPVAPEPVVFEQPAPAQATETNTEKVEER